MNIDLYNNYLAKKSEVATIQNQIQLLGQQLYQAENELIELRAQVDAASNDALLASLI